MCTEAATPTMLCSSLHTTRISMLHVAHTETGNDVSHHPEPS